MSKSTWGPNTPSSRNLSALKFEKLDCQEPFQSCVQPSSAATDTAVECNLQATKRGAACLCRSTTFSN